MKMDMGKMKERGEKMVEGRPGGRKRGWDRRREPGCAEAAIKSRLLVQTKIGRKCGDNKIKSG